MTYGLYVTYDKVAEEYSPVFQQRNDNVCKRVVGDLLVRSPVSAKDYALYKVACFDSETGVLTPDYKCILDDCSVLIPEDPQPELFEEDKK